MTDPNTNPVADDDTAWPENSEDKRDRGGTGVQRPDQSGDTDPSREEPQAATGRDGATGAGGFGI